MPRGSRGLQPHALRLRADFRPVARMEFAIVHAHQAREHLAGWRTQQGLRHRLGRRPDTQLRVRQRLLHGARICCNPELQRRIEGQWLGLAQAPVPRIRIRMGCCLHGIARLLLHGMSVARAKEAVQRQQFGYHRSMDAQPDLARIAATVGDPRRI